MNQQHYDLCVIGGGINGAGIARDAAGRGLSVLLVEMNELAGGTSSASTKLIHGGLRYLEHFEFRMVREALSERAILLKTAPHIVKPMTFVLPYRPGMRPVWLMSAGLFLYDRLAPRSGLPASEMLNLQDHPLGEPLKDPPPRGFTYADGWTDDKKLVLANAKDAKAKGAKILTHTLCTGLRQQAKGWQVNLKTRDGKSQVGADMVINATGPWVRRFLDRAGLISVDHPPPQIRLVKGSHIVVPRAYDGDHAYVLQQPDKRIVFAIPYQDKHTLIGTTEEPFTGDPSEARISEAEKEYLCAAYNNAFTKQIGTADIVGSFSGVRPLFDDGSKSDSAVTRDFRLHHHAEHRAPLLSIYGGKLTTYRLLAERAVTKILKLAGRKPGKVWTHLETLP